MVQVQTRPALQFAASLARSVCGTSLSQAKARLFSRDFQTHRGVNCRGLSMHMYNARLANDRDECSYDVYLLHLQLTLTFYHEHGATVD